MPTAFESPPASTRRPRPSYGDRFIPVRNIGGISQLRDSYSLLKTIGSPGSSESVDQSKYRNVENDIARRDVETTLTLEDVGGVSSVEGMTSGTVSSRGTGVGENSNGYERLLRSELLGTPDGGGVASPAVPRPINLDLEDGAIGIGGVGRVKSWPRCSDGCLSPVSNKGNSKRIEKLSKRSSAGIGEGNVLTFRNSSGEKSTTSGCGVEAVFHRSPIGASDSVLMERYTLRTSRKISKTPFKVLDAPQLQDDFYLNLVDWSAQNILAVGLGSSMYLWSAWTSKVTKLCDAGINGSICSVAFSHSGREVAVGMSTGIMQIWDTETCRRLRTLTGHCQRVGTMAWNSILVSSGSRDLAILNRDMRAPEPYVSSFRAHSQELCGLRWSHDDLHLASGGNDNKLFIWSLSGSSSNYSYNGISYNLRCRSQPLYRFADHKAAVKAIAWSPHARGLLASGGGAQDRTIRFWNTMNGTALNVVETGSQVCNLAWSKNVNEFVSTHGYSQNNVVVWRYPSLSKVVTLPGRRDRVLYLAVSPSGETVVTGAGDQSLRFWNIFPPAKSSGGTRDNTSALSPKRMRIR